MRTRHASTTTTTVSLLLLAALAGCEAEVDPTTRRDGSTAGADAARDARATLDAGSNGGDAGGGGGGDAFVPGDVISSGIVRPEICGNNFDDDDNGMIDDGCDCAVGTSRACWPGPPELQRIGACRDGTQRCQSTGAASTWGPCESTVLPTREVLANGLDDDCDGTTDEPDGICVPTEQVESGAACANGRDDDCDTRADCDDPGCAGTTRCPPGCLTREALCWGDVDDDCDGMRDCADSDCAADPSCQRGPCPAGQVPTYRQRDLGRTGGASSITAGDGRAIMPLSCEAGMCGAGQVAVVLLGQRPVCVPPPPPCPEGQHPTYAASGTWRCEPPCELVIHYGSLFDGRRVCASRPRIMCGSGQVPTFIFETESWQCRPTCNNTTYDRLTVDGLLVCVPC